MAFFVGLGRKIDLLILKYQAIEIFFACILYFWLGHYQFLLPQEITLEEFQAKSGIVSWTTAKDVLEYIINDGIGVLTSRYHYLFTKADRMKLSILALQKGCDIESISKSIAGKILKH